VIYSQVLLCNLSEHLREDLHAKRCNKPNLLWRG